MIYRFGVKDNRVQTVEEQDCGNPDNGYYPTLQEWLRNLHPMVETCMHEQLVNPPKHRIEYGKGVGGVYLPTPHTVWTYYFFDGLDLMEALEKFHRCEILV